MMQIRRLRTPAELAAMQQLEMQVWPGDPGCTVALAVTFVKNGGLALGAFDGDRLVGISYGFPGYRDGQVYLCSHVLGVLAEYRHQGVGEQLKLAQREAALELGYALMTWTYDPLQAPNAWLNIAKLGCVVRRYEPNCYGEMDDELNAGLPSDRFVAEWWLNSPRVLNRIRTLSGRVAERPAGVRAVNPVIPGTEPAICAPPALDLQDEQLLVLIPANFHALRQADMAAARDWRTKTSAALQHYLGRNYYVAEFCRDLPAYLLRRGADQIPSSL